MDKLLEIKDYDIERAIISLMIENEDIRNSMTDFYLNETFFKNDVSKILFWIILNSIQEWKLLDYLILKELSASEVNNTELEKYFTFSTFYPKKDFFWDYVKVLLKNYKRNELVSLTEKMKDWAIKRNDQTIAHVKKLLEEFEFTIDDDTNPEIWLLENDFLAKNILDSLDWKVKVEEKTTLYTWYRLLDNGIGGIEKWNYVIFAARPSVGKSIAMLNLMESMKLAWSKVMFFSWEMYWRYVLRRIISINLGIDGDKLKFPDRLSEKERKRIIEFVGEMEKDNNRHIYYSPKMCALDIYQHAKNIKKKYWLDAIFIDYIGKLYPNNGNMSRSRNEIVSDISRELYELAGALNIAVVTASQLSREGAKTMADGLYEPKLTDLRDSGSLEQDCDICIWLSRDKEAAKHCVLETDCTDFKMSIIKNRNGKMDDFVFSYFPTLWKLADKYDDFNSKNPVDQEKKTKSEENQALINDLIQNDNNADSIINDIFWND